MRWANSSSGGKRSGRRRTQFVRGNCVSSGERIGFRMGWWKGEDVSDRANAIGQGEGKETQWEDVAQAVGEGGGEGERDRKRQGVEGG
jgi:hypothetical protein